MYILSLWNTIQSFSISNMVSEPSLWFFLCSPVFISIISDSQLLPPLLLLLQPFLVKPLTRFNHCLWFWTCSCRHSESQDHCHTVTAVIFAPIVFLQVLLRSSSVDLPYRGNLTIIGAAMRPHAPPENSAQDLTRSTRLHAPPGSSTRRHAPARAKDLLLTSALGDVICHVIYWRHPPRTCWHQRWPLTIDFDWTLTLPVDFLP